MDAGSGGFVRAVLDVRHIFESAAARALQGA